MARDITREARRATMAHLKADAGVTALVPAAQIHPGAPLTLPTWPFVRWGSPMVTPVRAACLDGAEIDFAFHAFAKPVMDGETMIESAEDRAAKIGEKIAVSLDRRRVRLDGGEWLRILWRSAQLIPDGAEAHAWHSVQLFTGRVVG